LPLLRQAFFVVVFGSPKGGARFWRATAFAPVVFVSVVVERNNNDYDKVLSSLLLYLYLYLYLLFAFFVFARRADFRFLHKRTEKRA